jgi:hypothetical protein
MTRPLPGLPLLLAATLSLAGCLPGTTRDTEPAQPQANQPRAAQQPAVPGWLPLHRDPRPGDYVIHQRLTPTGLAGEQRRSEVIRVDSRTVEVRLSRPGRAALHLLVHRDGVVQHAWHAASPGTPLRRATAERRETRLAPAEDLALVSGTFPISHVVIQRQPVAAGRPLTAVYYLADQVPFREVVSLTSAATLSARQLQRLLGRIAVLTRPADEADPAAYRAPIEAGWILVQWGRGQR